MVKEPYNYKNYTRHEAVSLFGRSTDARHLCGDEWVILPKAILCFATIGFRPKASYFRASTKFVWVATKDHRVADDPDGMASCPQEVQTGNAGARSMHLFVRRGSADSFQYLGKLGPSYVMQAAGRDNFGEAEFDLSPALPSSVWSGLGVTDFGDTDHHAIDAALSRLKSKPTYDKRFAVLKRLVEYWYGPVGPEDGLGPAELGAQPLPQALRDWYEWAGRRPEILSGQNHLMRPGTERAYPPEPHIEDGRLVFYMENQGVYSWSTLPEGKNPPMFGRHNENNPWEDEGCTVLDHLIHACLFDAVMCHCRYGAWSAEVQTDLMDKLVKHMAPVSIGPWKWCNGSRCYAGGGAFMWASGLGETNGDRRLAVQIGAKTEHPLTFLKPLIKSTKWYHLAI
ncbi:MAG: hypothetical protein NTW19_25395 [Planctomycetota bacterium]|nr:hypothetical protein [Planctomycetota bacterium]